MNRRDMEDDWERINLRVGILEVQIYSDRQLVLQLHTTRPKNLDF
jgi:hypothetical protein